MHHRRKRRIAAGTAGLAAALASAGPALAGGFALDEGATDWMANAYAGETAKAYDAATAWSNPAGMVRITGNEADASVNLIAPHIRFSGGNSVGPGLATPGSDGGDVVDAAATAGTYAVVSLTPTLKLGLAFDAPFGGRANYQPNWVGRYQSLVTSATDIAGELSLAYAVTPHFSIGGGPVVDYFSTRQTRDINLGPPLDGFGDPLGDVNGSDVGVGYNLAAMYQFDDATRIGISYRSRIEHRIPVQQSVTVPASLLALSPLLGAALAANDANGHEKFNLPDSVSIGFYRDLSAEWALMADVVWTHWSLFNSIVAAPDNPALGNTVEQYNFHNAWFGSLGTSYRPRWAPRLLLQAGAGFDGSPVDNSNRDSRVPDTDRVLVGLGATYELFHGVSVDGAYTHYFGVGDGAISSSTSPTAGLLTGTYRVSDDSFSLGLKARF